MDLSMLAVQAYTKRYTLLTYFSSVGLRPGIPEAVLEDWKYKQKGNEIKLLHFKYFLLL